MRRDALMARLFGPILALALAPLAGCEQYLFLPKLPPLDAQTNDAATAGSVVSRGEAFTEILIQGRTFSNGAGVTTIMYHPRDATRVPRGIDFNEDGKIDPVVVYATALNLGVVQILLSKGDVGDVSYTSLTLDANGRWKDIADAAVADIDNDGALDIVIGAADGVAYLHNPGRGLETVLRDWGAETPDEEFLAGSTTTLTNDEVEAILSDVLPPAVNLDSYDVTVEQGYSSVETGDMDGDQFVDVIAGRHLRIDLAPKQNANVPPLQVIAGELQVFLNPGGNVTTGVNWTLASIGKHERFEELDRSGATGLLAVDMDGDSDLDIVSAARDDENAQITWYENPGRVRITELDAWIPWRVGSVRDALAIDVADLTGDGRPDVVATGTAQQQLLLFEQPATGAKREFDWDTYPIVTFSSFAPHDVKVLDIDLDGQLELVVGGTNGALRYFEVESDPRKTWTGVKIVDFDPAGDVGALGYGDLDGDGDLDILAAINDIQDQGDLGDRVVWVENGVVK